MIRILFSPKREAFECCHGELFIRSVQVVTDSELAVLDKFLVQQARFFVEFGHSSLGNILYHLLG